MKPFKTLRRPTTLTTMQIYRILRKSTRMTPVLAMQCAMRDGCDRSAA